MPHVVSIVAKVCHATLFLYAAALRRVLPSEMLGDVAGSSREAWGAAQWPGLPRLWLRPGANLLPAVALQGNRPADAALTPGDREIVILLLLLAGVFFVITATIIITLWFAGPLRRRRL